jgi:hypothetical protein
MEKANIRGAIGLCLAVVAVLAELIGILRHDGLFVTCGLIAVWAAYLAKNEEARHLRRLLESGSSQ